MVLPLRDYLAQRRAEVQASIKALRCELAELDAAERALPSNGEATPKPKKERGSAGTGKKTLKEMALEVLEGMPNGLEAVGILDAIQKVHGITVRRESLSPQLSRLRQDGHLILDGSVWKLPYVSAHIIPKNETPGAPAPSVSSSLAQVSLLDEDDEIPF